MANIIPDKIHIISVKLTNANVTSDVSNDEFKQEESLKVSYSAETGFSEEGNNCQIKFTVNFSPDEDSAQGIQFSAEFTIVFVFVIDNLDEFKIPNDKVANGFLIDSILGATLMGIVYSTSRGIILTRTAGTILDSVILPVIDPAELLGNPIINDSEN